MIRHHVQVIVLGSAILMALVWGCGQPADSERPASPQAAVSPKTPASPPVKTPPDLLPHPSPSATVADQETSPGGFHRQTEDGQYQPPRLPPAPFMGDALTTDGLKAHWGEPGVMRLTWQTQSEKDNYGFVVMRGTSENENNFVMLNEKSPVLGAGNSSVPHSYEYYDKDVKVGEEYYYFLKAVDIYGNVEKYSPILKRQVTRLYLKDRDTETSPTGGQ